MKLSKRQQEVIDLMKEGWILICYSWGKPSYTIQKKGEFPRSVNTNTVRALRKRGLIKSIGGYNPQKYILAQNLPNHSSGGSADK